MQCKDLQVTGTHTYTSPNTNKKKYKCHLKYLIILSPAAHMLLQITEVQQDLRSVLGLQARRQKGGQPVSSSSRLVWGRPAWTRVWTCLDWPPVAGSTCDKRGHQVRSSDGAERRSGPS